MLNSWEGVLEDFRTSSPLWTLSGHHYSVVWNPAQSKIEERPSMTRCSMTCSWSTCFKVRENLHRWCRGDCGFLGASLGIARPSLFSFFGSSLGICYHCDVLGLRSRVRKQWFCFSVSLSLSLSLTVLSKSPPPLQRRFECKMRSDIRGGSMLALRRPGEPQTGGREIQKNKEK